MNKRGIQKVNIVVEMEDVNAELKATAFTDNQKAVDYFKKIVQETIHDPEHKKRSQMYEIDVDIDLMLGYMDMD